MSMLSHAPCTSRTLFTAMTLGVAVFVAGCASTPPPTSQLAVAQQAVNSADTARSAEFAPLELRTAREKLLQAEQANLEKDYDRARELAEQAEWDARVAERKAQAEKAKRGLESTRQGTQELREESLRRVQKARPPRTHARNHTMRTHPTLPACLAAGVLLTACASNEPNPQLEQARAQVTELQNHPKAQQFAAIETEEAKKALGQADFAFKEGAKEPEVSHLAYLTERRVELARQTIALRTAEQELEGVSEERARTRLEARDEQIRQLQEQLNAKQTER